MSEAKRTVIANSAFKELLNVSPFGAPMELIEFVVKHTNPKLREFRFKNKIILFTRGMVTKVLGVPSGDRPMDLLKRSVQSDLRGMYKNKKGRTSLAKATEVLKNCADTDVPTIIKSFGLIALGTVLCPGTGNMVSCEHLGSMLEVDNIEQYAIDEHILCEVMKEVDLLQLSENVELNPSASLNEWLQKTIPFSEDLEVPPHLYALYKKHKDLLAVEVNEACANFGNVIKALLFL
ncbi:unnamed protein product [Alopecurus aequalis]